MAEALPNEVSYPGWLLVASSAEGLDLFLLLLQVLLLLREPLVDPLEFAPDLS